MKPGALDVQGLGTTDKSHLIRRLGQADAETFAAIEERVRAWLAL
jgi:mRNA-degrading endonuclease toxin of MazEF toxin-antitoxin module